MNEVWMQWQLLLGATPDWVWALTLVDLGAWASVAALVLGLMHMAVAVLSGPPRGHQGIGKRPDRIIPPRGPSGANHPLYGGGGPGGHQPREKTPERMTPPKGGTGAVSPRGAVQVDVMVDATVIDRVLARSRGGSVGSTRWPTSPRPTHPPSPKPRNTEWHPSWQRGFQELTRISGVSVGEFSEASRKYTEVMNGEIQRMVHENIDTDVLIATLDAMVDAGAHELPINQAEHRLLQAHLTARQQFFDCETIEIQVGFPKTTVRKFVKIREYMGVPLVIVPKRWKPDPPLPLLMTRR